jgi:hypothetical protein
MSRIPGEDRGGWHRRRNFPEDLWEEGEMEIVLDMVKSECEVRAGRPPE